ncbi:MAG: lantibiotic dehydratase [Frankiaceae bacterium]
MADEHLIALPGTGWHAWRSAVLRSAGFPADGMARFANPELAGVADRFLAGEADAAELTRAFDAGLRALAAAVHETAADPAFRCALAWQNPGALSSVAGVLRDGPDAPRTERRRRREDIVAKYWQRYCLKNDTIGFFGPMCWTTLGDESGAGEVVTGGPGPGLVRAARAFFEWWALAALGDRIAADPRVRPWLPVRLQPHVTLRGRELLVPGEPPQRVAAPTAALLALAGGRHRAADLAAALAADPAGGFRRAADVHAQLAELADRGVLRIGFDLPMDLTAEDALRAQLREVDDPPARDQALAELDGLCALRDAAAMASAATDPDELAGAMAALEQRFVELTGREPRQRPGQTYAGRTLCHLDTVRDLDIAFGGDVLARLAPLEPLLRSARWLTAAVADAYAGALAELHEDLAADGGSAEVPFADLWFVAQGLVFGEAFGDRSPAAGVTADFVRRWGEVLGLADVPPGTRELRFTAAELTERVAKAFSADAPGWAHGRIHSPDLHLCAPDRAALERGEYVVVLGELHIGLPAFDSHFFAIGHPDQEALRAGLAADLPHGRVRLLVPPDWPRHCARNAEWMHGPHDVQLGFVPAPGAHPERHVPITALTVGPGPTGLRVRADDGRQWPLVEMFAYLFDHQTFDTWKLAGTAGCTPRIWVDGLVLVRETWRTTVGATGLADVTGERDRYLAVRRWRASLGMPDRVFVRVDTELKPFFVDLTSPLSARLLCTMLRGALAKGGPGATLTVTELLPGPEDAWLVDAAGRRYASELRLQIRDPVPAVTG